MSWHEQRAAEPTLHTDVQAVCSACVRCSHVCTGRARNERAACHQCSPLLIKGRRNHCGTVTCTLGSRGACASQNRHRGCRHSGSPFQNLPVRGRTCASHRPASRSVGRCRCGASASRISPPRGSFRVPAMTGCAHRPSSGSRMVPTRATPGSCGRTTSAAILAGWRTSPPSNWPRTSSRLWRPAGRLCATPTVTPRWTW